MDVTVGGKSYELALWDTAGIYWLLLANYMLGFSSIGQEDYGCLRPLSYPDTVSSDILCSIYIHSFHFSGCGLVSIFTC